MPEMDVGTPYTDRFWTALEEGRFLVQQCGACGEAFFPPAPACPACHDDDVDWEGTDGRGEVYSFTTQHRTPPGIDSPATVGIVELDAGPRLLAPFGSADELSIGRRVELRPAAYEDGFDRGRLADRPFFVAVPLGGSE